MRYLVLLWVTLGFLNAAILIEPSSDGSVLFHKEALDHERLELAFGTKRYTIEVTKRQTILDSKVIEGYVENDRFSYFNLAYSLTYTGTLSVEGKNYAISSFDGQTVTVREVQTSVMDNPIEVNASEEKVAIKALGVQESGDVIDVLAVYTFNATSGDDINSTIASALAYANKALENSCAKFRYRLVGTKQIFYSETRDMGVDLSALYNNTIKDYSNIPIHDIRNTYGADLVMLWVGDPGYNYCGLAYVNQFSANASEYGYSVVLKGCPIETTAHELGHNMGASHDRYTEQVAKDDFTLYRGYGFIDLLHNSNSIMSYGFSAGSFVSECKTVTGRDCSTVPYFSNPNIIRDGVVFGIAGSEDTIGVMNDNRVNIANFRATKDADYTLDLGNCQDVLSSQTGVTNCFVATVAFGSYLDKEVVFLRDFRDEVLLKYAWGEAFVSWYYEHGPYYARYISDHETLKGMVRSFLYGVVFLLRHPLAVGISLFLLLLSFVLYKRKRLRPCA